MKAALLLLSLWLPAAEPRVGAAEPRVGAAEAPPAIVYVDRATGRLETEAVYGGGALGFLYGPRSSGAWLLPLVAKLPAVSWFYGLLQDTRWSARQIRPFIARFGLKTDEFLEPVESFRTFNEFFYRKLKPEARPIRPGDDEAVLPADARYLFFPRVDQADGFVVKGKKFGLAALLQDPALAARYEKGSLLIARLCPTDYHRFHFPSEGVPGPSRPISGWRFSVNPIALRENIEILAGNKRSLCELDTPRFGKVLYVEVGATLVGGIRQTYAPGVRVAKGREKGYFAFGASAILLLFEPGCIAFDADLLAATRQGREIKALMGQSLGRRARGGPVSRRAAD